MTDITISKCPTCGITVETDCGSGCSDHRDKVRVENKRRMAELREKKASKREDT